MLSGRSRLAHFALFFLRAMERRDGIITVVPAPTTTTTTTAAAAIYRRGREAKRDRFVSRPVDYRFNKSLVGSTGAEKVVCFFL